MAERQNKTRGFLQSAICTLQSAIVRVPLAWLNLTHDRLRFALFAAGIGFAVVLMFLQYGCRNALLDSNVLLLEKIRADLILASKRGATIAIREPIARVRLEEASSVRGVRSVHPLFLEYELSFVRNAHCKEELREPGQNIRVVGVDPDAYLLKFPELDPSDPQNKIAELKRVGTALFDRRSQRSATRPGESAYGPIAPGVKTDLAERRIEIVGTFALGSDFASEGTLIVSSTTFSRWFRQPPSPGALFSGVELGLVRLEEGADRAQVQRAIQAKLNEGDVEVLTLEELLRREKRFWLEQTPIGFVFGFGMIMGFIVGTVICYQILSSDVADHLPEYATLKAIGYSNTYVSGVVLQEALLLALAGFLPGWAISAVIYALLAWLTGLPMNLTPGRVGLIAGLTAGMCALSGLLAVRKVQEADPADVFG